jgi:hypothetical protein
VIPAFDGIGMLPDGKLVGFGNPRLPYGAPAERIVVASNAVAPIPDGIEPVVATVLGTAITEILLRSQVPESFAFPKKPTRVSQVGEAAGSTLALAAASLRTSVLEICGAAKGLGPDTRGEVYGQIVRWTRSGELTLRRGHGSPPRHRDGLAAHRPTRQTPRRAPVTGGGYDLRRRARSCARNPTARSQKMIPPARK